MSISADFTNLIIYADDSISDITLLHDELRDIESSVQGVLAPVIHTYKELDLGGGAKFPAIKFINGWTLQFPAGSWRISGGNLDAYINPVAGCYVDRVQSAAYAVSSADGGYAGPSLDEISNAVRTAIQQTAGSAVWGYER